MHKIVILTSTLLFSFHAMAGDKYIPTPDQTFTNPSEIFDLISRSYNGFTEPSCMYETMFEQKKMASLAISGITIKAVKFCLNYNPENESHYIDAKVLYSNGMRERTFGCLVR